MADEAISASILQGATTQEYLLLKTAPEIAELAKASTRIDDNRFAWLYQEITRNSAPDMQRMRLTGQSLLSDYCGVPLPQVRCINAVSKFRLGWRAEAISLCQEITSLSSATCIETYLNKEFEATNGRVFNPNLIKMCSGFAYRTQADCLVHVSNMLYSDQGPYISACSRVKDQNALDCVKSQPSLIIYPDDIEKCAPKQYTESTASFL